MSLKKCQSYQNCGLIFGGAHFLLFGGDRGKDQDFAHFLLFTGAISYFTFSQSIKDLSKSLSWKVFDDQGKGYRHLEKTNEWDQ